MPVKNLSQKNQKTRKACWKCETYHLYLAGYFKSSDLRPQTSDLRPQTSDLRPQTSDLRPQTSDLRPQTSDFRLQATTIAAFIFLASSKNLARPISVKGCFSNPKIDSSGQVQTLAPASAHFTICSALRMEAASISVL